MIIECDDNVYNPLGGGSYVFEKDIANFLLKKFNKSKIAISIGAQPNSSPHFRNFYYAIIILYRGVIMKLFNIFKKKEYDYEKQFTIRNLADTLNKNIKMLVIADTHGDLAIDKSLANKLNNIKENDYDICLILGDISDKDYKIILSLIPKNKILALLGNHDRFGLLDEFGLYDLNGQIVKINGIKIGGIQGSYKYKDGNYPSFNHEESIKFLDNLDKVDILVSHDKPFTINNNKPAHDGLKGITKYLYDNNIFLNIHGHLHESNLTTLKNGTSIKSAYLIELIEVKNGIIDKIVK